MTRLCTWAVLLCTWLFAFSAAAAVDRFAVIIGNNHGDAGEQPLQYAESEAQALYSTLKDVGRFLPENMLLLQGEPAAVVQRALISMNDRVRARVTGSKNQVALFVYYSGHADASALHLSGSRLELLAVEQLVRSSAAAFRVLVVDACRSGALTRVKGGRPAAPFLVHVETPLAGEGVVFLTSSAANEDAQESDALRGSFFTHYLRTGLLGPADEDQDRTVTLDEAYRYAYENTLRSSSRTFGGLQHPTYSYELKGRGELILSFLGERSANRGWLKVPAGSTYLIFERNADGAVAAEVPMRAARRNITLEAGTYFVRARAADHLLEGTVNVLPGAEQVVDESRLTRVDYARLVRKGDGLRSRVHGVQAAYFARTALPNESGLCHGGSLGYALVLPSVVWSPRIFYCSGGFSNEYLRARAAQYGLEMQGVVSWDLPAITVDVAAIAGGSLHRQDFVTRGDAPARSTFGIHVGAGVGFTLELGWGMHLFSQSVGESHWFAVEDSRTRASALRASAAFRQQIGVGKYW